MLTSVAKCDWGPTSEDCIAVHLRNVEFVVCATEEGGAFQVIDLRQVPAIEVDAGQLPSRAGVLANQ